jgi:hypothetical protein
MKIKIRTEDCRFTLFLPVFWALGSPLTHWILRRVRKKLPVDFPDLTAEQRKALRRGLKSCKKRYKGLSLVEVDSSDGEVIRIFL